PGCASPTPATSTTPTAGGSRAPGAGDRGGAGLVRDRLVSAHGRRALHVLRERRPGALRRAGRVVGGAPTAGVDHRGRSQRPSSVLLLNLSTDLRGEHLTFGCARLGCRCNGCPPPLQADPRKAGRRA